MAMDRPGAREFVCVSDVQLRRQRALNLEGVHLESNYSPFILKGALQRFSPRVEV
jgi:hypothetical protein